MMHPSHGDRFNVLSLQAWLEVAAAARVPAIPARRLGAVRTALLFEQLDGEPPEEDLAWKALLGAINRMAPDEMLRWDCCASGATKAALADGHPAAPERLGTADRDGRRWPRIDDLRLQEIIGDYPGRTMPVFARPWITARMRLGTSRQGGPGLWPVEWRVFVEGNEIVGVSNYYPQSPAPMTELDGAASAVKAADRIVRALEATGAVPHHPMMEGLPGVNCTLDFLEAANGWLLLIEGGPPHLPNWGAHPCCFAPGRIAGVALVPQG